MEHSDYEIGSYTVQDDGSLLKENYNPSTQIISGAPQNIYIFKNLIIALPYS